MSKHENQSVNINPDKPIKAERVASICRNAGIDEVKFDELRQKVSDVADEDKPLVH